MNTPTHTLSRRLLSLCPAVLVVLASGCPDGASRDSSWGETYPVSGQVLLNGVPVEGATVGFSPVDGGQSARGRTDANGNFTLRTFFSVNFDDEGALGGEHRVTLYKAPPQPKEETEQRTASTPEEAAQMAMQQNAQRYSQKSIKDAQKNTVFPKEYRSSDTTPLRREVKAGEPNEFKIEVNG